VETVEKIDQIIEIVERLHDEGCLIDDLSEIEELRTLDAEICGECSYLGVAMPGFLLKGDAGLRFGFTEIPYVQCSGGWDLIPAPQWTQAMRGLRASVGHALRQQIELTDIATAKSHAQIVAYAEQHFQKKPSERSIQNWIDDDSLRARKRGQLWEFSISDLRTLVMGRSG